MGLPLRARALASARNFCGMANLLDEQRDDGRRRRRRSCRAEEILGA